VWRARIAIPLAPSRLIRAKSPWRRAAARAAADSVVDDRRKTAATMPRQYWPAVLQGLYFSHFFSRRAEFVSVFISLCSTNRERCSLK
jgi:hypothetical protein